MRAIKYSVAYFGGYPREAMKILLHMVVMQRKKGRALFNSDDLGKINSMNGRAISGVLSSFGKRDGISLLVKAGTIDVDRNGKSYNRPKQLWMLNPKLMENDLEKIENSLEQLLAIEGWCPMCGYTSTNEWRDCEVIKRREYPASCPTCGGELIEEERKKKRLRV